jgi:hypothetical protein
VGNDRASWFFVFSARRRYLDFAGGATTDVQMSAQVMSVTCTPPLTVL